MSGTIKKLNSIGFGYILSGELEYFFHKDELSGIQFDELCEGDAVSFDVLKSPKGLIATNVQRS